MAKIDGISDDVVRIFEDAYDKKARDVGAREFCYPTAVEAGLQAILSSGAVVLRSEDEAVRIMVDASRSDVRGNPTTALDMRDAYRALLAAGALQNNPASLSTPVSSDSRNDAQIAPRNDVVTPEDAHVGGGLLREAKEVLTWLCANKIHSDVHPSDAPDLTADSWNRADVFLKKLNDAGV
jgi:hypothetical protein